MGRWLPDARSRLQNAALELFAEQGFEATTVDEIAARTGLTQRTFFRYFADKREVLFDGQQELVDAFVGGVAETTAAASVVATIGHGLDAVAPFFPASRQEHSRRRQQIIDATVSLQERELHKLATLTTSLAAAFATRGVPEPQATLAGETAVTVFRVSFDRWRVARPACDLGELLHETLAELRALTR